jgi:DNA-binding MarR family transcriptional regulator
MSESTPTRDRPGGVTQAAGLDHKGTLGEQRNLTPSGSPRSIDRIANAGPVQRRTNPADGRGPLVGLTHEGLACLGHAQLTHHAVVRELPFARLQARDLKRLARLWERAMTGSMASVIWPI